MIREQTRTVDVIRTSHWCSSGNGHFIHVDELQAKTIHLAMDYQNIISTSLDCHRMIYETEWQALEIHVLPEEHSLFIDPWRLQPKISIRPTFGPSTEFVVTCPNWPAAETCESAAAMLTCASMTMLLQTAEAGPGGAVQLVSQAAQSAGRTPSGRGCSVPVMGMSSMMRVAAMEFGEVHWAWTDRDDAYPALTPRYVKDPVMCGQETTSLCDQTYLLKFHFYLLQW